MGFAFLGGVGVPCNKPVAPVLVAGLPEYVALGGGLALDKHLFQLVPLFCINGELFELGAV